MKSLYIDKFKSNNADIEITYNDNINEVEMWVSVAEFVEKKVIEKEELKQIINRLTEIYNEIKG